MTSPTKLVRRGSMEHTAAIQLGTDYRSTDEVLEEAGASKEKLMRKSRKSSRPSVKTTPPAGFGAKPQAGVPAAARRKLPEPPKLTAAAPAPARSSSSSGGVPPGRGRSSSGGGGGATPAGRRQMDGTAPRSRTASVGASLGGERVEVRWASHFESYELTKDEFYVSKMPRAVVEKIVKSNLGGDFLVRDSSSSEDLVLVLNDMGQASNYVVKSPSRISREFEFAKRKFPSVDAVLEYIRGHPLRSVVNKSKTVALGRPAVCAPWFWGHTTRSFAERCLKAQTHGMFLIRKNSAGDKFVLCVNDSGQVANYNVDNEGGGRLVMAGEAHDSVWGIVHWLEANYIRGQVTDQLGVTVPCP